MLAYGITVDWSLLVNVPPFNYNNLLNIPPPTTCAPGPFGIPGTNGINGKDGMNGKDGKDADYIIIWGLLIWCFLLTIIIIILLFYICKQNTKLTD